MVRSQFSEAQITTFLAAREGRKLYLEVPFLRDGAPGVEGGALAAAPGRPLLCPCGHSFIHPPTHSCAHSLSGQQLPLLSTDPTRGSARDLKAPPR